MKPEELLEGFRTFLFGKAEDLPAVELAEGADAIVECGRPGKFQDMHGQTVTFTPENLTALAGTLDPEDALCKIGHLPIETDTPDYGRVKGLAYDAAKERLLATIAPTPALVRKNREEGFRRVSMEITGKALEGPFGFKHLSFLAARKPGISGLAPLQLAAAEGEKVFAFADGTTVAVDLEKEMPKPLDTAANVNPESKEQEKTTMADEKLTADLAAANAAVDKHRAEADRLREQLKSGARTHVAAFLAEHSKRIPLTLRKAGLEEGLVALLAAEVSGEPITLHFAVADGDKTKTVEQIASAFVFSMLAALPEQVSKNETTETAKDGVDDEESLVLAEGVTKSSQTLDFAARKMVKEAKANGEEIDYFEALRRIESKSASK